MMIFWEAGLVLLAVPKTGTQALEAALSPQADILFRNPPLQKHMPLRWYRKAVLPMFNPRDWKRLETVAVIREPVDWLGSWYRYRRRSDLDGAPNSTAQITFVDFVEAYLSDPQPGFAAVGRQSRFLRTKDGAHTVQHLFAYERLEELQAFFEDRLSLALDLPYVNVSPSADLSLPTSLETRLRAELQDDIALHAAALGR